MKKIYNLIVAQIASIRRINKFILEDPQNKKTLLIWIPVSLIVTQASFGSSYIYGQIVNMITRQKTIFVQHSVGSLISVLLAVAILVAWNIFSKWLRFVALRKKTIFQKDITNKSQLNYWKAYAKLDLQDRESAEVQDAVSDAQRNYSSVLDTFSTQWDILTAVIITITSIAILGIMQWWYILLILSTAVPSLILSRVRKSKNYNQQKRLNELKRYSSELTSNIGNKETIVNGTTNYFLERYESLRKKLANIDFGVTVKFQNIGLGTDIWTSLIYGIIYLHIFYAVYRGVLQVGTLFIVFNAMSQLQENLSTILSKFVDMEDQVKRVRDFFLILDMKPAINDIDGSLIVDQNKMPLIEFENVWFKYPESENYILKGVTFTIEPGERVALVGENGAGKTTISMLLLRFYDPNEGSVRINGIDLRLVKRDSLFAISGAVFQDFNLYQTRCSESIRSYATEKHDFNQIVSAAQMAGIHDFIESLPEKYDHKIGKIYKGGIKPSGGQRQKFAIASLIHRNPKLLVLDELTSALSPTSEDQIVKHYAEISQGKTCLVICQRYKSLEFVDRIIVLENGIVVEEGTHATLVSMQGVYANLFKIAQLRVV